MANRFTQNFTLTDLFKNKNSISDIIVLREFERIADYNDVTEESVKLAINRISKKLKMNYRPFLIYCFVICSDYVTVFEN